MHDIHRLGLDVHHSNVCNFGIQIVHTPTHLHTTPHSSYDQAAASTGGALSTTAAGAGACAERSSATPMACVRNARPRVFSMTV
jgi:hypothetical protein